MPSFRITAIVAALALATWAPPTEAADPITIKISDHFPVGHVVPTSLTRPWMERVEELSGGNIEFQYFPAEQLVKQRAALPALQRRIVDITLINPGLFPTEFALTGVAFLPGGYSTIEEGGTALERLLEYPPVAAEFEKSGIMPLLLVPLDPYELLTRDREVRLPEDVAGLRIRAGGDGQVAAVRVLGGTSVALGAPEIYTAVQRGTIDGSLFPYGVASSYRMNEVSKYGTLGANVAYAQIIYCVNSAFWEALDPEHQEVLKQAAEETVPKGWASLEQARADAIKTFEESGMTIVRISEDEGSETWSTALNPVRQEWAEQMEANGQPGNATLEAWDEALAAARR